MHATLRDDTLNTGPHLLDIVFVQNLVKRHSVEKIRVREMLVVGVAVEMTDFTHNLIGVQQPSVRTVEGQTYDGVFEDCLVLR